MKKSYLPNSISFLRIVLSLYLLFIDFHGFDFIILYAICGLSDVADGLTARLMKCESNFGARLDSLADVFMTFMIIVVTIKQNIISMPILIVIIIILSMKIINGIISKIKFNKITSLHTIANKTTGLLLFFCPLAYNYLGDKLLIITCVMALISSIEEAIIFINSKMIDLNRKSLFIKGMWES
jgi:phosphatidylglycerophosphate synthase